MANNLAPILMCTAHNPKIFHLVSPENQDRMHKLRGWIPVSIRVHKYTERPNWLAVNTNRAVARFSVMDKQAVANAYKNAHSVFLERLKVPDACGEMFINTSYVPVSEGHPAEMVVSCFYQTSKLYLAAGRYCRFNWTDKSALANLQRELYNDRLGPKLWVSGFVPPDEIRGIYALIRHLSEKKPKGVLHHEFVHQR